MKLAGITRAAILVALTLTLTGCQAVLEPRSTMTVDDVVDAFTSQPDLPVTNPQDISDDACVEVGCSAAIRADEISIYRFDIKDDAETFANDLGDNGYQSDWVVLEYPGAKSDTDRALLSYAGIVDSMWASD
ncbi:hypothetical protein E3O25_13615 [Cryobacterium sp. TMT1-3]|uniref:hypothetical protein n=1 Tax=Cryobacterium sp. TMT1-3 TaxID=1259237 RepID=UPI0011043C25|nr:hypothetical protein [Cryobacterium sp. TMT1-3]TFC25617.1 hypothetical protein E3O25_13615 [Cryobacterium sp. TMT1-3]